MNLGDVKRMAAIFYGLTREQMEGQTLNRRHAWPRQVAMTMCRHYTTRSTPQIGMAFGNRDHTTVLHAIKAVKKNVGASTVHAQDIALLCAQIEAGAITVSSVWATAIDRQKRWVPLNEAIMQAEALRRGTCKYFMALKSVDADFSNRDASAPSMASVLSGPRVLRLRGPGIFSVAA